MTIEAMKQALEALERYSGVDQRACDAEEALRTAIKAAEKQEPVGEVVNERGEVDYISYVPPAGTALYTTPPTAQRQWVGLTRNEAMEIINPLAGQDWRYAVDAIEAKLKEKNT